MIYCIWYPSGGFGHFINSMICLHGENFARPDSNLILNKDGNCHAVPLLLGKYKNQERFVMPKLDPSMNYTVLIDNGITDESLHFLSEFPDACSIKVCYDDKSWPIVAYTHIVKAMRSDLDQELDIDPDRWPEKTNWAKREKFFLYLRDHELRHRWRESDKTNTLPIYCLYEYDTMQDILEKLGIHICGGREDWFRWYDANQKYISPVIVAQQIIQSLIDQDQSLDHITDIWTQAVIYYYLYLEFGLEVPHNDYPDFFSSTGDIKRWLKL